MKRIYWTRLLTVVVLGVCFFGCKEKSERELPRPEPPIPVSDTDFEPTQPTESGFENVPDGLGLDDFHNLDDGDDGVNISDPTDLVSETNGEVIPITSPENVVEPPVVNPSNPTDPEEALGDELERLINQ